jgi:hypothetical protein
VILSDKASALHFVLLHRKCSAEGMLAPQRRQNLEQVPPEDSGFSLAAWQCGFQRSRAYLAKELMVPGNCTQAELSALLYQVQRGR